MTEYREVCGFCQDFGRKIFRYCKCHEYYHEKCLNDWKKHSKRENCQICKAPYNKGNQVKILKKINASQKSSKVKVKKKPSAQQRGKVKDKSNQKKSKPNQKKCKPKGELQFKKQGKMGAAERKIPRNEWWVVRLYRWLMSWIF